MSETIEQNAAKTILQEPECVNVGGVEYRVAPPSTATLIMVSQAVSTLPTRKLDRERVFEEGIAVAAETGETLADIVAILILGAKTIRGDEERVSTLKASIFWRIMGKFGLLGNRLISSKERLRKCLLEQISPRELLNIAVRLLGRMQITDFFALTTSLSEINLLKQTREVEMTQSGQ